jgi:hypothetical protein
MTPRSREVPLLIVLVLGLLAFAFVGCGKPQRDKRMSELQSRVAKLEADISVLRPNCGCTFIDMTKPGGPRSYRLENCSCGHHCNCHGDKVLH